MELLKKLNQEEQVTMMLVTHDPVAASYCDRVVFIKDGSFIMKFITVKIVQYFTKTLWM